MRGLDEAGRLIAKELADRHGLDLGAIEVREAGIGDALLVKPSAWTIALEHEPSVQRDEMTPTTVMQIANILSVHNGVVDRICRVRDAAHAVWSRLETLAGHPVEIAIKRVDDILSKSTDTTYVVIADLLDDTLGRTKTRVTSQGKDLAKHLAKLADIEARRQKMVAEAGSRRAALCVCSVAAAAIRANPGAWRQRVQAALGLLPGVSDVDGMRDGVWLPRVELGKGVHWRRDTLIVAGGMPDTLQMAIVGKPLSAVVEHPWLPEGAKVMWTKRRMSEEVYLHTTAQTERMRDVWETQHIKPLVPLINMLEIRIS